MTHRSVSRSAAVLALVCLSWSRAAARDLTFEERVRAQEAIERVYYAHQVGATRPFDQAVPRSLLESKVRASLRQSLALESIWSTLITGDMLQKEAARMAAGTRMPERLRELFAALGNDPVLIRESLARPALATRLVLNFFDNDPSLHARERRQAEELAADLSSGRIDPWSDRPDRFETDLFRAGSEAAAAHAAASGHDDESTVLDAEEFDAQASLMPQTPGSPAAVAEERGRFVVRVPLARSADEVRFATYAIAKRSYDEWWRQAEGRFDERSVAVGISSGAVPEIAASSSCADDTWDNGMLDDLPLARSQHTAVWTGSLMLVWGGGKPQGGRYDPATDTWTPISMANQPTVPSGFGTAVWTGSRMIVWGGNYGATYLSSGGRYDPVADTWLPTSTAGPGAPFARYLHTAIWTGDRMIVWGGGNDSGRTATGGSYDPDTDTWTATSLVNAPTARAEHTAVWTGTRMIVWGGFPYGPGASYDPSHDSWSPVGTTNAPIDRSSHSAVWTGSTMVVFGGGTSAGVTNTGGRYDPVSDTWTPTSLSNAPAARVNQTAVWTGSRMIVWGGNGSTGQFNTGARYDPVADVWTPTSTINPPTARLYHSTVWTGSQMIVWGGTAAVPGRLNSGGRYDPVADAWTPTSTGGAPPPRTGHVAAWTGSLMLIYGGTGGNSGGRYDPALDVWTGMSTLNAPFAARYATAIWNGNVMIVWGGLTLNGVRYLNEGSRYDPVNDTWSPTSTSGAPSPRASHTAIWTGSRMIVWGGYIVTSPQNMHIDLLTGGVYDPAADTWASTSTVGAPTARSLHAAVWTGQRMVVWGGFNISVSRPTDGGLYDPISATWAPMSKTNAPAPRARLVGAWTGQEAIFWGGDALNTGGRYNPSTDTWTTMSLPPDGRDNPSVVWTGREMIVFGGAQTFVGGRYDPAIDRWMPTSVANVPQALQGMSSVWTGTFMIVWGGNSLAGEIDSFNTGGRYCAACASDPFYFDHDGDGFGDPSTMVASCHQVPGYVPVGGDCNDVDGASWGLPSEATDLGFLDNVTLSWSPPAVPGGVGLSYDLLRSASASDFVGATACVASDAETFQYVDPETPPLGGMFAYLVRAQNHCPGGEGSLGTDSNGVPRTGRPCP